MEGNAHVSQLGGCSLSYRLPFHSLPDRARKAGECKADAILERNREKSFFFHFPVTEAWCGSSLLLGRKEGKIALLPSTSRAPWSPCPGLSPCHRGCPRWLHPSCRVPRRCQFSPTSARPAPAHGCQGERRPRLGPVATRRDGRREADGCTGTERQVCAEMGRYRHRQTRPPPVLV